MARSIERFHQRLDTNLGLGLDRGGRGSLTASRVLVSTDTSALDAACAGGALDARDRQERGAAASRTRSGALDRCAQSLLEALAEHLRLPQRALADMAVDGNSILRLVHYPALDARYIAHVRREHQHSDKAVGRGRRSVCGLPKQSHA